jgi:hypothetical protein
MTRARSAFAIAVTAGIALALIPATSADAAGLLATSTTVTATPATSVVGTSVTLKAIVKVLGLNGLGVTPRGPVTFTSHNLLGAMASLGTVSLSSCFLTPCVATLVTSAMPVGTISVTGAYGGDGLSKPSQGSAAAHVNPNPSPGTSQSITCYSGQPCATGTMVSADQTTQLQISATASSGNQTVSGSLTDGTLQCSPAAPDGEGPDGDGDDDDGVFVGALATFETTASDVVKTVTYTGTGTTGATMYHQYAEHTAYASCYGQDTPWQGYTTGVYGPAPFNATDGLYVAQLPNCANHGGQKPCFTNSKGSGSIDSYVIKTLAGDPKNVG